jgi:hypothetical protein
VDTLCGTEGVLQKTLVEAGGFTFLGVSTDFLEAGKMRAIGNGFPTNNVDATRSPGLEPTTSSLARSLLYHCTTHSYAYIFSFILLILYHTECKSFFSFKQIQIQNFSTKKFHNFLRSTTLCWSFPI